MWSETAGVWRTRQQVTRKMWHERRQGINQGVTKCHIKAAVAKEIKKVKRRTN